MKESFFILLTHDIKCFLAYIESFYDRDIKKIYGSLIGKSNNREYTLLKSLVAELQYDGFEVIRIDISSYNSNRIY